jgi:hypothetical protein
MTVAEDVVAGAAAAVPVGATDPVAKAGTAGDMKAATSFDAESSQPPTLLAAPGRERTASRTARPTAPIKIEPHLTT